MTGRPHDRTLGGKGRQSGLDLLRGDRTFWDLIIIGGGITGAGVLREATRRGLKVLLVEQKDFAWGTSSRSSKMVHGGLRYLATGDYPLTRDSVRERERLMEEAPGLVDRLPFMMPHYRRVFPGPRLFNLVLWVYDWIAGHRDHEFFPLQRTLSWVPGIDRRNLKGGTRFADALTDDARLVLRVMDEAVCRGGVALNYMRALSVERDQGRISGVALKDEESGDRFRVRAGAVVNATGAWADQLRLESGGKPAIRPLRGSHLVVPFWRLPVALTLSFFHPRDRRPVFVFPWEGVTVIGTTDLDHRESLDREAAITEAEVDYLLEAANRLFPGANLQRPDIQSTWSGVRPVVGAGVADPSKERREHVVWDDGGLVSVAGGKLTTFRLIARDVLRKAAPYLPELTRVESEGQILTAAPSMPRPGGVTAFQWRRLRGFYGFRLEAVLNAGEQVEIDQSGTLWCELVWAARNEAVVHLDDLMLRRTRLGLLLPRGGMALLDSIRHHCQSALEWDDERWQREVARYAEIWQRYYSLPAKSRPHPPETAP